MTDAAQILRSPGRHVVAGKLTAPTASTAAKGWRGVMLELFPRGSSDFTAIFDNPGITLYLNGLVDLYQRFEGRCAHTVMRPGNMIVSPPGIPKKFQYDGDGDCLVVHVAPSLLMQVANTPARDDPGKIEILNEFCTRDPELQRLTLRLWNEYVTQDIASGIYAEAIGIQLAVHMLRKYSTMRSARAATLGRTVPDGLREGRGLYRSESRE